MAGDAMNHCDSFALENGSLAALLDLSERLADLPVSGVKEAEHAAMSEQWMLGRTRRQNGSVKR